MQDELQEFIKNRFGITTALFLQALKSSPSANGYITGAISELLLKNYLENIGYEVLRIKEKPAGGNNAKNNEARGDFYIRKKGGTKNEWLVRISEIMQINQTAPLVKGFNIIAVDLFLRTGRHEFAFMNSEKYLNIYTKII